MNHERFEELLALSLYDELEAGERGELDAHLGTCGACRAQRDELRRGLGRLVPARLESAGALPSDWDAALARAIAAQSRVRARPAWIPAVASFAAGLLVTWLVLRGAPNPSAMPTEVSRAPSSAWSRFHADSAPPRATSSGSLGRLVGAIRH